MRSERDFPLRWRPYSAHRLGSFRSIRVRWTRGNRRSAPDRLWPRTGVADVSCHSGTKGAVDSRPLPMAPLCLGSPWRSATERLGASSLGFDMACYRHYPSWTGGCAYRRGLLGGMTKRLAKALLLASVGALPDRAIRLTLGARSPQLADAH